MVHTGPGTPFDLQGFIDQALAAGQKRVVVPPGRYRVKPQRQCHLRLRDLQDVEIMAKDVEMVCTETTLALSIDNCRNVALRGMTIDYDPLPFTQGRITAMAPDKKWLEFELFDGYPENLEARVEIFDQKTETLKRGVIYCAPKPFKSLGQRRYRLAKPENYSIAGSPLPNIHVSSTKGLIMTGNKCMPDIAVKLSDWHMQHYGLDPKKLEPIMTVNCEDVRDASNN